jgi:hypothetical protein
MTATVTETLALPAHRVDFKKLRWTEDRPPKNRCRKRAATGIAGVDSDPSVEMVRSLAAAAGIA